MEIRIDGDRLVIAQTPMTTLLKINILMRLKAGRDK